MKKYFTVYDDYMDKDACNSYIQMFDGNSDKVYVHEYSSTTSSLSITPDSFTDKLIRDFNIQYRISNLEVVKRSPGSHMKNHYDKGDALAFVVYLNDSYEGGHTVFEDKMFITPQTGRMVLFTNGTFQHRVSSVISGERYILAGWFK